MGREEGVSVAAGMSSIRAHVLLRDAEAGPTALPALGPRDTLASWKPLSEGPHKPLVRVLLHWGLPVALQLLPTAVFSLLIAWT